MANIPGIIGEFLGISGHNLPLQFSGQSPCATPNSLIFLDLSLRTSAETVEDEPDLSGFRGAAGGIHARMVGPSRANVPRGEGLHLHPDYRQDDDHKLPTQELERQQRDSVIGPDQCYIAAIDSLRNCLPRQPHQRVLQYPVNWYCSSAGRLRNSSIRPPENFQSQTASSISESSTCPYSRNS